MEDMEDMAWDTLVSKGWDILVSMGWDMLGMVDTVVTAMLPLSTMDTTMLLTLRCPPLPPFLSLEQPLLLCLESWEPEPMLELVAMLLTLLELSMWPRGRLILIMLDTMALDMLDMEDMLLQWFRLSTLFTALRLCSL